MLSVPKRVRTLRLTSLSAAALLVGGTLVLAQEHPSGITVPRVLPPFDLAAPSCQAPVGLASVLAFAKDNQR